MTAIPLLVGPDAQLWIDRSGARQRDETVRTVAAGIIEDVRRRGDEALRELTQRYDGVTPDRFRVLSGAPAAALAATVPQRRDALQRARRNIETFHAAQVRREPRVDVDYGIRVWREFRPIRRVGIYVPGGHADYPSTVLMCGVPARLAGCAEIAICVPPGEDGSPPDSVLAAAALLGIDEIYAVGGAQAVAAMAFGTESIAAADKIFGPGNRYVTAAKELVHGIVDIDMPAGPSEIVILADDTADAGLVAADLISQAEHSPDALAVCVTTSAPLARLTQAAIESQLADLPHPTHARASLASSALCLAPDLDTAIDWTNRLAAEHLSIVTADEEAVLERIEHAGSVFLGPFSPVAAGDYAVGSNHVLPTGRRARSWSALSVADFGRWMQVQRLEREGLRDIVEPIATLARWEGLEGHARAAEARFARAR